MPSSTASWQIKGFAFSKPRKQQPIAPKITTPATLHEFVRGAWHVVEPGIEFIDNWHIGAICEHLEAVRNGEIRRLLITVPPGHMKSLLVAVMFPAWVWTDWPEWRVLTASYAADLAMRDAVKSREIILSDWYSERFNPKWSLSSDQNVKSYYKNTRKGERVTTSVGGGTTGLRADAIIIDDPLSIMDSYSDVKRAEAIRWLDQSVSNRLGNPSTGAIVMMQQRTHRDDPAGHVIEQTAKLDHSAHDRWERLNLPSEFDPDKRSVTTLAPGKTWSDPRQAKDELLFEALYPKAIIDAERRRLGGYGFSAQHQQNPDNPGQKMFKREWFPIVEAAPSRTIVPLPGEGRSITYLRRWDLAATEGGGDYTAGVLMCYVSERGLPGMFYILDVVRFQKAPGSRNARIKQQAQLDKQMYGDVYVGIPKDPGSAGIGEVVTLKTLLAEFAIYDESETGSKEVRARPLSAQAESGNVKLLKGDWNEEFLKEIEAFPGGNYDDQVDGASGGQVKLARSAVFG